VFYKGTISTKLKHNAEHFELGQELYKVNLFFIEALRDLHISSKRRKKRQKLELRQSMYQYIQLYNITRIPRLYGSGITAFFQALDCKKCFWGWSNAIDTMKLKMEALMPNRLVIKYVKGFITPKSAWKLQNNFF